MSGSSSRRTSRAEFEEDFISWKVLGVGWSETVEEVVVWYYDVEMAAELDITEEDCELARETGIDFALLEYSSIAEMREWLQASACPNYSALVPLPCAVLVALVALAASFKPQFHYIFVKYQGF